MSPTPRPRAEGTLARGPYLVLGALLFGLKHNLDRIVASAYFGRSWSFFNYLAPPEQGSSLLRLSPEEVRFYGTLLLLAVPFIVVGVVLTSFSELAPPTEWIFRVGVAYPMRATIDGSGPGAVRHCIFSTGAFEEPITVWDDPHRLAFNVRGQPAPLQEWTPWRHLEPLHLNGYLRSERGEFRLVPRAGGGTRLEGTTWYRHELWPAAYWQLWSDAIIHRIHARVLQHIRREAEAETRAAAAS